MFASEEPYDNITMKPRSSQSNLSSILGFTGAIWSLTDQPADLMVNSELAESGLD